MTTAQVRLNSILPTWYELLTQWSQDGSLAAAATEALVLDGSNAKRNAQGQLQSMVSQWSAGNFKSLPEILLLSNEEISGAQGAYAESTGTIYLNADWLLTADVESIQQVLTEELGHSLDAQLNLSDTVGDKGSHFSTLLSGDHGVEKVNYSDEISILLGDNIILAEASRTLPQAPYTQFEDSVYTIVLGETFEDARYNAQQLGGDLVILNSHNEFEFLVNTYQGFYSEWQSLWIGITDAAEEGVWLNVDGTLAGYNYDGQEYYLPWFPDEPNNFQGEDYGVLTWSQYWTEQYFLGREGVNYPAGLNDINNFTATGYNKAFYGIAEIKLDNFESEIFIGTAISDAATIIISGNLSTPTVESYALTTTGRGKKKTTSVGTFTNIEIDQSGPLDALVVYGGDGNNLITGNGFADNPSTSIDETRSAFTGILIIDGKGGADTITGGASGINWLIGGGVNAEGTVDTLTGVASATDIFDLRRQSGQFWEDAYSIGNAVINGYDHGDYIILAKDQSQYQVINQTQINERTNKRGKVTRVDTVTYFEIKDLEGDLIATVNGSSFTPSSSSSDLKIVYGQNLQSPFEVVLPGANPGIII